MTDCVDFSQYFSLTLLLPVSVFYVIIQGPRLRKLAPAILTRIRFLPSMRQNMTFQNSRLYKLLHTNVTMILPVVIVIFHVHLKTKTPNIK